MSERMFIAITPPQEAVADLDDFVDARRSGTTEASWVRPDGWHLTLAFLPSVDEAHADDVAERLDEVALRTEPFPLALTGAGAFPSPDDAKVVWTGICDPTGALPGLAAAVRGAANATGVKVDGQGFTPHLTLARLRFPQPVGRLIGSLDTYAGPTFTVDEVQLIASLPVSVQGRHGRSGGRHYAPRATVRLGR